LRIYSNFHFVSYLSSPSYVIIALKVEQWFILHNWKDCQKWNFIIPVILARSYFYKI
jgi:hypothetical protein